MKPLLPLLTVGLLACCANLPSNAAPIQPPAPYGPVPTDRQLRWHEMEYYGFLHFTVNTFTDKEWGYGDENPKVFNPSAFDANQIVRTAKEAGMAGVILTAKHHDGFCLWPSRYTEHSVRNSDWKNGHGDVVREIADACRRYRLKFGVYLSPWDRNHAAYSKPEYIQYYRNQLRELLTQYGDIFTVWFDGANGGDGFYGGAREMRRIDNRTYYDWKNTWQIVRDLMPQAVMFSDVGPDFRWVGNERGIAGEPCWATLNVGDGVPGNTKANLNQGERPGSHWVPAECDVSIRPGWFYHASEDSKVKTPAQLLEIYYQSVGRGACLNLNLPPDRRGIIHENDVASLREFRRILDQTFDRNLARQARLSASNIRGQASEYHPRKLLDDDRYSCWTTDDAITTPELILQFRRPITFNIVGLRECLPLGQRIEAFALDQWKDGRWQEFAQGTSIGNRRLLRTPSITTDQVRLRISRAAVCPALAEFGLYVEPGR
ncbi:MAG TPA: alpha-L-fucosidase [Candidatus Paceibacterota bacterium]|nr:alpha-L-fucosidase [Verrucomicrobiota bacterium]HRY48424.1 alpha-L-fucosidase [Candidatus Paceibacterota bacterium]